jgi:hypothetical protein
MNKERQLLPIFNMIGMATVYHFQPWLSKHTDNFKGSLAWSTRLVERLRREELIQPVTIYPYIRRTFRYNAFYSIKPNKIANRDIEHQSGLIDVLMAFLFLYKDYEIQIDYEPKLRARGRVYRPDALVKMIKGFNEYHFIVEFERTRGEKAIYEEKLLLNEKMPSFKDLGLSPKTKILYIYSHEWMSVFWRPNQYDKIPEAKKAIGLIERKFPNIIKFAKDLPDHKYRFIPYHQFFRLNEAIWTTPKGNKIKLIQ